MPSREQEAPDKTKNVDVGPVASRAKTGCVDVQGGCWSWSASDLDFNGSPTSLHVLHGWMCSSGTDVGEEKSVSIAPIDIAWCVLGGQFSHQDQIFGGGGVLCCRTVTALSRGQFRPKNIPALLASTKRASRPSAEQTVSRFKGGLCSHPCQSATIFSGF